MASNNDKVLFVYDAVTKAPAVGVPIWSALRNVADNTDQSGSAPTITPVAGGIHKIVRPAGVSPLSAMHLAGVIDCGVGYEGSTEDGGGRTRYVPFELRPEETADVINVIGTPSGADLSADVAAVKADTASLVTSMVSALGLMHENSVMDTTTFDALNNLTSGRLRLYNSKANAQAAGATGLLATYSITATYVGGNLGTYTVVKEP